MTHFPGGRAVLVLFLALWCLGSAASSADWQSAPDPAPESVNVTIPADLTIPFPRSRYSQGAETLYPAAPSPFVVVGHGLTSENREVWSLLEGKSVGKIATKLDSPASKAALSPDGKHLVVDSRAGGAASVDVWSFETETVRTRISFPEADRTAIVDFLGFAGPDRIVVGRNHISRYAIDVFDVADGKLLHTLATAGRIERKSIVLSPGGKYVAMSDSNADRLTLFDVTNGRQVETILCPRGTAGSYICHGLGFSPDGTELACLLATQKESRLVGWSMANGKQAFDLKLPGDLQRGLTGAISYKGDVIDWIPGGRGWLLYGHAICLRESGQIVWTFKPAPTDLVPPARRMFDAGRMAVVSGPINQKSLTVVSLPWPQIDAALGKLKSSSPAHLKPGQKVAVQIDVSDVRFADSEKVKTELTTAVTARLKSDGFEVAAGHPTVFNVKYSEAEGAAVSRGPLRFGGPPRSPSSAPPTSPPPSRPGTEGDKGSGTAFVVHSDGYLLTCAHVVGNASTVEVTLGEKKYTAKVLAKDTTKDIALIRVEARDLPTVPLVDSDKVELGEELRAIGFPLSFVLGETIKVTRGSLAGIVKKNAQKLFQVDAAINPGNSGGPLVNERGGVVGIISAKVVATGVDSIGFCVPINDAKEMLQKQKIVFETETAPEKLDGPALVKRVAAAVAFVVTDSPTAGSIADTGVVKSTKIACDVAWRIEGQPAPVWSRQINHDPTSMILRGEFNSSNIRDSIYRGFLDSFSQSTIAYYISNDADPVVLPGVTDLGNPESAVRKP